MSGVSRGDSDAPVGAFSLRGIPHHLGDQNYLSLALWPRLRQGLERLRSLACFVHRDPVPVPDVPLRTARGRLHLH